VVRDLALPMMTRHLTPVTWGSVWSPENLGLTPKVQTPLTRDNAYINCMTATKRGCIMDAMGAIHRDFRAFSEKIFFTLPPTHNETREREQARPSHGQQAASMGPPLRLSVASWAADCRVDDEAPEQDYSRTYPAHSLTPAT
jgi:hypothetical protein